MREMLWETLRHRDDPGQSRKTAARDLSRHTCMGGVHEPGTRGQGHCSAGKYSHRKAHARRTQTVGGGRTGFGGY